MEENILIEYRKTGDILKDTEAIVEAASRAARTTVNVLLVQRNWLIGKRISDEEMAADGRAEYGMEVIKRLSKELTSKYGRGYTKSNLYSFYAFYKTFPEIFQSVIGKSDGNIIIGF